MSADTPSAISSRPPCSASILRTLAAKPIRDRLLEATAAALGVDWKALMLANVSYDFIVGRLGCSTALCATERGPVLFRNMDWWPEELLAQSSIVVASPTGAAGGFISAAWPGAVGIVTGMSRAGFAVALNAVSSVEPLSTTGYPVLLHLRCVLEDARSFEEAVDQLALEPLTAGAMFAVIGQANEQRVVVERTPSRAAVRRPCAEEPLVVTNDYRALDDAAAVASGTLEATACARFDALTRRARALDRDTSDERILDALQDPAVVMSITAQHVIARPREQGFRLFVPRRLL